MDDPRPKKIYIFDVDGTLTPPREQIDQFFEQYFLTWVKYHDVFLVSGSDLLKLKEQLPRLILSNVNGVFACAGNVFYLKDKIVYENAMTIPDGLIETLEEMLNRSKYERRTGNHIEHRKGMINFSVVGRNASPTEREDYHAWDSETGERKAFASELRKLYAGVLDANVGGNISIDIHEAGKDKSQIIDPILEMYPDENITMAFFGDKMKPGGNDYPLAHAIHTRNDVKGGAMYVSSYHDTWKLIMQDPYVT